MHFFKTSFYTTSVKTLALSSSWKKNDLNSELLEETYIHLSGKEKGTFLTYRCIIGSCCCFVLYHKNYSKILGLQNDGVDVDSCEIVNGGNKNTSIKLKNRNKVCVCVHLRKMEFQILYIH